MDEFEMALVLKRAMQAYGSAINEYGGLGIFKDLLKGVAIMELKLEGEKLVFTPHTPPSPAPIIELPKPEYPNLLFSEEEKT